MNGYFDGTAWVVRFAFGRDVIGLLQEVVEGTTYGAVVPSEDGGLVEAERRDGEVFVDVGNVVHVLVPYRACRRPVAGAAEDKNTTVADFLCRIQKPSRHNLSKSVTIDVNHNGVLNACSCAHPSAVKVVGSDGVVACDVAFSAAVKDTQVLVVTVHEFHDAVLVEVEKRESRLSRGVVVLLLPNGCETV